jgi:hypothetical protein
MEGIKTNDKELYDEIVEKSRNIPIDNIPRQEDGIFEVELNGKVEKIMSGNPKWLTNISIDELRIKTKEFLKPMPILIDGIHIHKNHDNKLLEGEIFKKNTEKNIEVSNFGRISDGNKILPQYDPQNNGYLFVDIKGTRGNFQEKVYRLVAETWLDHPDNFWAKDPSENAGNYNTVHHISNNGYDNRIENLMWVTRWQHAMIHPWIKIDDFSDIELVSLLSSYQEINFIRDDYPRMLDIVKRYRDNGDDFFNDDIEVLEGKLRND